MTFTQFCFIVGLIGITLAAVVFVLMAMARKITRTDDRLHEENDFTDFFDHR